MSKFENLIFARSCVRGHMLISLPVKCEPNQTDADNFILLAVLSFLS